MAARAAAGGLVGIVFGVVICWSGMTAPDVIRDALLFREGYLFLFMASAVGTAMLGTALLRRAGQRGQRAVLTGEPLRWDPERPERRHIAGALVFGLGWGLTDVCPGPVLTQVGQGVGWSLLTVTGVMAGVWWYSRSQRAETEPAADGVPAQATATA